MRHGDEILRVERTRSQVARVNDHFEARPTHLSRVWHTRYERAILVQRLTQARWSLNKVESSNLGCVAQINDPNFAALWISHGGLLPYPILKIRFRHERSIARR